MTPLLQSKLMTNWNYNPNNTINSNTTMESSKFANINNLSKVSVGKESDYMKTPDFFPVNLELDELFENRHINSNQSNNQQNE